MLASLYSVLLVTRPAGIISSFTSTTIKGFFFSLSKFVKYHNIGVPLFSSNNRRISCDSYFAEIKEGIAEFRERIPSEISSKNH